VNTHERIACFDAMTRIATPGTGPRLLSYGRPVIDLHDHLTRYGPLPYRNGPALLIGELRSAGLTDRSATRAAVHETLAEALDASNPVVVASAARHEPVSAKDRALLLLAPHLVLDGIQLVAEAVRADDAVLAVGDDQPGLDWLTGLIAGRRLSGLDRTAVTIATRAGRLKPGHSKTGGARGAVELNVETLAHVSLIARYGAAWFRRAGTADEPGTVLLTLHQPDGRIELTEAAFGTPLPNLLDLTAAASVLVGGGHGTPIPVSAAARLTLSEASLAPYGATIEDGVLAALPASRRDPVEAA
jgi:NADH:ubiquinone oxidoreductase subunit F (NADH-binding)